MKLKPIFDWKFRDGQAALVAIVLALLFFTGCAASSSVQADSVLTCRKYSVLSELTRQGYVMGFMGGYGVARAELIRMILKQKNDPKSAANELAVGALVLEKIAEPVSKLTLGAIMEMLEAECHKDPDAETALAFRHVIEGLSELSDVQHAPGK